MKNDLEKFASRYRERLIDGPVTAILGTVAVLGSDVIPNYNQELKDLHFSVSVAGTLVALKGALHIVDSLN